MGGAGNDKLVGGDETTNEQRLRGEDGDDILYGGNGKTGTEQSLYGDYDYATRFAGYVFPSYYTEAWPEYGGNDKIYGGNEVTGGQLIVGGPYDDKIFTGHGVTGAAYGAMNILVYGDKDDLDKDG